MTYIYDVVLNFNDDDNLVEFYEWDEADCLDHIKKILLFRISSRQMEEISNYKIKVSPEFLSKIKGTAVAYKNKNEIKYGALFSDLNKVVALEFNHQGFVISRSCLLLDEEEDIIDECSDIYEEKIEYQVLEEYQKDKFLTREERNKKRYLLKEIRNLYEEKNLDKFNYLYEELYDKDNLSLDNKFQKMYQDINMAFSQKHKELYEIVRLTYTKNRLS